MSAESEVSYSKVSGTEVSKINPRFMYGLCMVYVWFMYGLSTLYVGGSTEKCLK